MNEMHDDPLRPNADFDAWCDEQAAENEAAWAMAMDGQTEPCLPEEPAPVCLHCMDQGAVHGGTRGPIDCPMCGP